MTAAVLLVTALSGCGAPLDVDMTRATCGLEAGDTSWIGRRLKEPDLRRYQQLDELTGVITEDCAAAIGDDLSIRLESFEEDAPRPVEAIETPYDVLIAGAYFLMAGDVGDVVADPIFPEVLRDEVVEAREEYGAGSLGGGASIYLLLADRVRKTRYKPSMDAHGSWSALNRLSLSDSKLAEPLYIAALLTHEVTHDRARHDWKCEEDGLLRGCDKDTNGATAAGIAYAYAALQRLPADEVDWIDYGAACVNAVALLETTCPEIRDHQGYEPCDPIPDFTVVCAVVDPE